MAFWISAVLVAQAAEVPARPSVQVVCNTGDTEETCRTHASRLSGVLARFDIEPLGDWTWVLVRSEDWRPILLRVGRDPDSPAFTILEKRQTFLEEALFARRPDRSQKFLRKWRVPLDQFPEFAVSHELGHALCRETDEARVIDYARQLRQTGSVTCQATKSRSPSVLSSESASTPEVEALRFFDSFAAGDANAILRALRPQPISSDERAQVLAVLPEKGELPPDKIERAKLSALEALLVYHERRVVFVIKVIDLPQAIVGLYQRAVLLISRPALRVLSASELQALVAHEIGHEYFWRDYVKTRESLDRRGRQALELKCDGIAVLTLIALRLEPARLGDGIRKITKFNQLFGTAADADDYPRIQDRVRFASTLLRKNRP